MVRFQGLLQRLQSALGYQTQATTQSGNSGGNSITYNVQQITLTSNGLLNQIITNLKGVNGSSNGGAVEAEMELVKSTQPTKCSQTPAMGN